MKNKERAPSMFIQLSQRRRHAGAKVIVQVDFIGLHRIQIRTNERKHLKNRHVIYRLQPQISFWCDLPAITATNLGRKRPIPGVSYPCLMQVSRRAVLCGCFTAAAACLSLMLYATSQCESVTILRFEVVNRECGPETCQRGRWHGLRVGSAVRMFGVRGAVCCGCVGLWEREGLSLIHI